MTLREKFLSPSSLLLLGALGVFAHITTASATTVALDQWGTLAITATESCDALFTCTGAVDGPVDGDFMVSNAYSSIATAGTGHGQASAALTPADGLATPTLKAEAFSDSADGAALASAFAVQAFTNSSGADQNIVIDISLDALVAATGFSLTSVSASLQLVKSSIIPIGADVQVLIDAVAGLAAEDFLSDGLFIFPGVGAQTASTTLGDGLDASGSADPGDILTLASGESAYFLASLTAFAFRESSSADAFSTLTTSVQNPGNFSSVGPATTATVPAPSTLGLLALGVVLSLVRRRRLG